ncbi:vgr related protein [Sphingomonas sabuli]|uniref:Vgr related protein n=1 Tax=Sphingomonas sabuli TaxID=2764186 RepID=A0A7G9L2A1_9SPHN|nr:vgr related protein [Sphingomonas sabuli]QNM82750.1 vgr related protein [Sphingomonas sabuli]
MHDTASRSLTTGEIALARSVFGDAIDYRAVKLVRRKWWPLQPKNVAMAPCGNIHFHPHGDSWSDDFAGERLSLQGFFIHEMTHVWQAQRSGRYFLPLMRHPFCRYRYTYVPGRPFARYGLEQQAEIVRHVFLRERGMGIEAPPRSLLPFADGIRA